MKSALLVGFGAIVGVALFVAVLTIADRPADDEGNIDAAIEEYLAEATPPPAFSAEVYQQILPSLVFIQVEGESTDDDGTTETVGKLGSGVVINDAGDILTSLHVVETATAIEVAFADGTRATAEIKSSEPDNDIAVLSADRSPDVIVPAVMGNTLGMRTGDEVFAVGNPLGLTGSLSAGVVSGFDRSIPVGDDNRLEGLIQFDAAVNPGNSGGPLLNRRGQVVGIVTALANPADEAFFVGIGFAVPIGTATNAAGGPGQ